MLSNINKKLPSKGNLNRHLKTYDKSKALECDICFKVFSNKSNLTKHYRIQTREKHFAFQVCERKFARKDYLSLIVLKSYYYTNNLTIAAIQMGSKSSPFDFLNPYSLYVSIHA